MNFHITEEELKQQRERMVEELRIHIDAAGAQHPIVRRFEKIDAGELRAPVRRDNGFLQVEGRLARVGIQEYYDGAGKMHRELRIPEEVFDKKSLESFQQVPVTNTHPPVLLDARNAKQYAVGSVGEDVRRDGDFMVARMMITDEAAIAAAEQGRSQLSNGYTCWLDSTQDPKLVEKWGPYDFIQREIRGNHVALVDVARAGPEARLRLDASDAAAGDLHQEISIPKGGALESSHHPQVTPGSLYMPIKFTVDGFELEVQDANAKSVIERAIAAAKKDSADQLSAAQHKLDDANKALEQARKDGEEWKSKHEKLAAKIELDEKTMKDCRDCEGTGKIDGKKCDSCDGEGKVPFKKAADDAHIASIIERKSVRIAAQRAKVVDQHRAVLGADAKSDGKTIGELRREVIKKMAPTFVLDGKSESTVAELFDGFVATLPQQRSTIDQARGALGATPVAVVQTTNDQSEQQGGDARARMLKRNQDAFQKPGAKK